MRDLLLYAYTKSDEGKSVVSNFGASSASMPAFVKWLKARNRRQNIAMKTNTKKKQNTET